VVLRGTVERRGDDLAAGRALEVGDLLRALVDEHDHEVRLGVVLLDRVRELLEHGRLAGLRRRDDEPALPLADRRHHVDEAHRDRRLLLELEAQTLASGTAA
jgi:hypothetical protein